MCTAASLSGFFDRGATVADRNAFFAGPTFLNSPSSTCPVETEEERDDPEASNN
jgi:hypothetical protein